jgi:multiple sugar transport system permease protein
MATRSVQLTKNEERTKASHLSRRKWSRYSPLTAYLFISPWLVGFLLLTALPLVYAFAVSFTSANGITPRWHWIGVENYIYLVNDPDTWWSLGRTLLYMIITVPLSVAGGLGLALLLNNRMRSIGIFRTIFYVPSVVPVVASAVMWKIMFDRDAGIINAIIEFFGGPIITWLVDPTAFLALIIMVLWGLGGGMVIFLAGLQGIPSELREAAAVDGANAFQTFRAVTLPLLTPVIFFEIVTSVIVSLQMLVQPMLLSVSQGTIGAASVPRHNYLYMVNVYQQIFGNERLGYGAALLWVLFVVILLITLLVFRSSTLWVYYQVDPGKEA